MAFGLQLRWIVPWARSSTPVRQMAASFHHVRLLLAAILVLCAPTPAHAQDDTLDRDIATARAAIYAAPLDQQAAAGEKLLPLLATRFGADSNEYVEALQLQATHLAYARRGTEAQKIMERVVAIQTRRHGADSYAVGLALRDYGMTLRLNGFTEQAVDPYRRYIAALTEEVFECGRIKSTPIGTIVAGCAQDEKDLGDDLANFGALLDQLGRADEADALFRATIARFEPRWAGCEGEIWDTDCDRFAFNRRDFFGDYAEFLTRTGKHAAARAIHDAITRPRLEALSGCADDACRADYWLLNDTRAWIAAVAQVDKAESLGLGFRWLPVLGAEPIYARGGEPDADYFDKQYRENFDEYLATLAKDAIETDKREQLLALLTPFGKAGLVAEQDKSKDYTARLAELDKAYFAASYADRPVVLRQKADLAREQFGDNSAEYADGLRAVAWELDNGDDDAATDAAYRAALTKIRAVKGDAHNSTWLMLSSYADWLIKKDRRDDAIALTRELLAAPGNDMMDFYADSLKASTLASGLSALSGPYSALDELHGDLAEWLLASGGDVAEALVHARHAATGKRAYRRAFGFSRTDEAGYADATDDQSFFSRYNRPYSDFQIMYADALWTADQRDDDAIAAAFLALQEAQMGTTSRAVARAAAERAVERGGVATLLAERRSIDATLGAAMGATPPADAKTGDAYQRWSREQYSEQRRIEFRRDEIDQEIRAAAPGYFELIRPQPLSVADAQALLAPDEALLMLVPSRFGIHSLLVTHGALRWHRSAMTEVQLAAHVRRLLWDVGASIDVTAQEEKQWSLEGEGDFPFDRKTAWMLYRELFAPFEAELASTRHLFTASNGSISSIPLGILVTAPPTGADGDPAVLRATPWLADKVALLQLPSLQSLQLLRAVGARNSDAAGTAMIGFGDPLLDGAAQTRGGTGRNRGTRSAAGLSINAGLQQASGDGPALADPELLRKLARLPGTETELKAMRDLLGARQTKLFLADSATETNMKRGDLNGLAVLFLATHGLIAGEVSGVGEPGLVFTPPKTASPIDDGLLTASEVASLGLGVRWVILSACNTASGDGSQGAPGLSGLARSFFFAGAESLLASHWPVRDDVAAVLTVKLFTLMRADPKLSRAEALQMAEKAIRDDPRADPFLKSWSHPSAWAPFSLIGDGIN